VPPSPEDVLAALTQGKPSLLLGMEETARIDFKGEPYLLGTEKGKWELGKDVAGLANLSGGVLVIGVRTKKTNGNFLDVATELCPVTVAMLDKKQHHSVIRDVVRPAVDFEIAYHDDPDEPGKCYMSIQISPLHHHERWAIVRRMVTDEGKLVDGMGVPIRDGDQTRWLSGDEVYRLIRDGQRSSSPGNRAASAVTARDSPVAAVLDPDKAVDRLIALKDWQEPVLIWQSMPGGPENLLPRMWEQDGIAHAIRFPSALRGSGGFNWNFWTDAEHFDDGAMLSDGRHAMWVQENGLVTAAAIVNDEMLAWATRSPEGGPYQLNLIALVEMTLEYFLLIDRAVVGGALYNHAIETRGFAGERGVTLSLALPHFVLGHQYPAGQDRRYDFEATCDAGRDAYEALWRLFTNFKLPRDKVPFSTDSKIDAGQLLEFLKTHHY